MPGIKPAFSQAAFKKAVELGVNHRVGGESCVNGFLCELSSPDEVIKSGLEGLVIRLSSVVLTEMMVKVRFMNHDGADSKKLSRLLFECLICFCVFLTGVHPQEYDQNHEGAWKCCAGARTTHFLKSPGLNSPVLPWSDGGC